MPTIRNIFACLVHESQDCVVDLVRNLKYLDPSSVILLYNGGKNSKLLTGSFPFERYGAVVHPRPRPLSWGRLHEFALDCMHFALQHYHFDTLTIVDSDQLLLRKGYSDYLARFLAGKTGIGLLGNSPGVMTENTAVGPATAAFRERGLWRPFLQRFPDGEQKFVHWTFWPSTVFTADVARELVELFAKDRQLKALLRQTRIWATEEVILPTLVALLDFGVTANPCSYDFVKYQKRYSLSQLNVALHRPDVYWVHPVRRQDGDPLRQHIRTHLNHYVQESSGSGQIISEVRDEPDLLLSRPIFERMKRIKGWLEEDEADLLIAALSQVLRDLPRPQAIVEVGSYCGRSTVVLGSVIKTVCPEARLYAIDPHEGKVGAVDRGIKTHSATLAKFRRNITGAGLKGVVELIQKCSTDVEWDKPIGLLLIDGMHDYANVARDFFHFEPWVVPEGLIAFHDYADYYPGVKAFVDELLATGPYKKVGLVHSMMVVRRLAEEGGQEDYVSLRAPHSHQLKELSSSAASIRRDAHVAVRSCIQRPFVSCIMPTLNRRVFLSQAIGYFLRQDYANSELIIVDDGSDPVA
ncbi:MAG: class I SAM-dependent methyltransferase, partial [Deltaproteobacteria bacterium]